MIRIFHHTLLSDFVPARRITGRALLCLALLSLMGLLGLSAEGQPPPLEDQFGASGRLDDQLGSVQVVIVVSAKRLRRIKRWEQAIRKHYQTLPLLRVADVPRSTPVEYDAVAAKLRKRLPDDVNVLIDLKGVWSNEYGLDTREPNILVFHPSGELAAQHAGKFKTARFEALRIDLDRLMLSQGHLE